jgi:hypothetical protein
MVISIWDSGSFSVETFKLLPTSATGLRPSLYMTDGRRGDRSEECRESVVPLEYNKPPIRGDGPRGILALCRDTAPLSATALAR